MSRELSDRVLILDREVRGDRLFHLTVLGEAFGCGIVLLRRSRRRATPDLYDTVQVRLARKSTTTPWFVEEFEGQGKREALARNWRALDAAARLSRFFYRNASHVEDVSESFALAARALDALEEGVSGEAVLIKTLFRFARGEGFAVREDWLAGLPEAERTLAVALLGKPLREGDWNEPNRESRLGPLRESLENWLFREADFRFE